EFEQLLRGARAVVVDGPGKDSFAGAALSLDKDRGAIHFGGLACDLEHGGHLRIAGDNAAEIIASTGSLDALAKANAKGEHLAGSPDGVDHVGEVKGLDEVVVGAEFHGFDGAINHSIRTHHDDDSVGRVLLDLAKDFDTVDAGENDVEEREFGMLFL